MPMLMWGDAVVTLLQGTDENVLLFRVDTRVPQEKDKSRYAE